MINPVTCEYCGSPHIRRSRRHAKSELLTMAIGTYPFRCLDCSGRFSVNVFLLSRLAFAKCPKCLKEELVTWPRKGYHIGFLKKLQITFGGRRYRCPSCRYNFVSFRPQAITAIAEPLPDQEPVSGELTPDADAAVHRETETHSEIS